jgi:putative transposase
VARKTTEKKVGSSRVVWTHLESMVRENVRGYIQGLLEEEVEDFLGRARYVRKSAGDPESGYRNGHGRPRKLTLSCGTVEVRRPRVRDMDERFESAILPLLVRRTREVDALIPELYLHGLAAGDMDLALRGLLGNDAPISAATVARLKERWRLEYDQWSSRSLAGLEVVALWVDGVYVKAGLEKDKAAILVAMAGLSDGRKVIVGMVSGYRESTDSWRELLNDLKERGMYAPKVVIGDGHLGIWGALRGVYPESAWQRCWNHKIRNVLDKLPKRLWDEAKKMLSAMSRADTEAAALELRAKFQGWCRERGHGDAADLIEKDWETLVAFYRFPKDHWRHLRTSNPIESPFDRVRLRTNAARRFKKVANATAVVWKTLMVAERRFRKLTAPELWAEVFRGVPFKDGVRVATPQDERSEEAPAA